MAGTVNRQMRAAPAGEIGAAPARQAPCPEESADGLFASGLSRRLGL